MRFCSQCGNSVEHRIPDGDNRPRHVCSSCGHIHYQNPRIVTGCLVTHEDRVLLCRRNIEPRKGYWTLPAGFLESGETTAQGAIRETLEEAGANVDIDGLYTLFNLPYISQVYMFYRARLPSLQFAAGPESLEVRLFHQHEIPWEDLAFVVVKETLEHYFDDRRANEYPFRARDLLIPSRR